MPSRKDQRAQTSQEEAVEEVPREELIQPPSSASAAKNLAELFAYHMPEKKRLGLWRDPKTDTYIIAERDLFARGGVLKKGTKEYSKDELWAYAAANNYFAKKDSDEHKERKQQWSKVLGLKN